MIDNQLPPISVIITARNESDNIYENLPLILNQDYPHFEVIVVVNQSVDDTKYILEAYQQQYNHLRFTIVEKNKHLKSGKKLPISLGIKAAKHEHLVMTDADCKPISNNWLKEIGNAFQGNKQIVIGFSTFAKKSGFLNKIIRYDNAWEAINYFSFALARLPYKAIGRNLAYTKDVYESVKGFKTHYALESGDDDLFVQQSAKKKNYTILLSNESHVIAPAEQSYNSWLRYKERYFSSAQNYRVIKKWLLGIYPFSLILMYISFVSLLFNEDFRWLVCIILGFIAVLKWLIQGKCFYQLKAKSFVALFLFNDILYAIISPILYYTRDLKSTNKW